MSPARSSAYALNENSVPIIKLIRNSRDQGRLTRYPGRVSDVYWDLATDIFVLLNVSTS